MDPVSALGVAAAAVQFVDFGSRLLSNTLETYKNATGQSSRNMELSVISQDLVLLATEVETLLGKMEEPRPGSAAEKLKSLCHGCKSVNAELQTILEKLQAKGSSKLDLAKNSFVSAVKGVVSAGKLKVLEGQMETIREGMTLPTLLSLWAEAQEQGKAIHQLLQHQKDVEALGRKATAANAFAQEIESLTLAEKGTASVRKKMALRSWKTGWLSDEIKQPLQINISNEDGYEIIQPFSVGFANEDSTKHWQVASAIRRSLYYETISYREDAIPCTYETTFEWIFEPLAQCKQPGLWSSFPSWLESESKSIYWITGKPGSGKSTLMKYITSKATLKEHLLRWSNDIPLLLASFYFWQAGTDVQKSQDGLLRSLLSQCLEQMPSVGRIACPKRWAFHEIFGPDIDAPPWEWGELVDSFHSLTSKSCNNYKLALFIDGLDEFSGNHASLVQFIEKISACDGIKICVSSRPWNVFSDAYKSTPSLRLEDLTKKDIELFVTRHFELHPGFKELSGIFPHEVNHLSETIVTKARGVFLWVSIVVQSLLTGLEDGDKLSDLQATLNDLPEDLQDLFQRIWDSIDERHKGNALQFIQLHRTARGPLHAVNLWLADEESPFQLDIKQLQIDKLVQVMKRRLNSRTKCLLEISFHGHVEYIHRTAYDWIQDVWQNICLDIPDEFDAFLELAKAESCYFLIAETLGDRGGPPGDQDWYWEPIQTCFWYAMKVKDTRSNTKRLIQILEHLHSNMQKVMESITWMSIRCTLLHKTDFIGLAAQFAIQPYVRAKISKKGKVHGLDTGQMSVLESVIFGWDCFPMEMIDELKCRENFASSARLELIGYLIEIGADTSCTCHTGDQISEAVVKRYGPSDEYGDAVLELLKKASAPAGRLSKRFWRKERKRVEK